MAMSATISLNPGTTLVTEQKSTVILTISNSTSTPINVTAVVPYVLSTGGVKSVINTGVSVGPVSFGPNSNQVVTSSASLVVTFPITFHAPSSGVLSTTVETYDVGATCYSDDGSVFAPTVTTVTVNNFTTYPTAQQ